MEKFECQTCRNAKTAICCGICEEHSCKSCSQFIDEDAFSFLPSVAPELTKGVYCHTCFEAKVRPELETYERTMATAADIDVFYKNQGKESRLIPRSQTIRYVIDECEDRDELVLRFAFRAVLDGFTTIVDVDIHSTKLRNGSYQKTVYSGSAVPAKAKS